MHTKFHEILKLGINVIYVGTLCNVRRPKYMYYMNVDTYKCC
jgi:hypothetical protein